MLTKLLTIVSQQFWLTREVLVEWRLANVTPIYMEGWKELQACQSDLSARKGCGAGHIECHHTAHTRQAGDQGESAWVCERQVLSN